MLWILDLDSIFLIVFFFFSLSKASFSPYSSHAMTDLSHTSLSYLCLLMHYLSGNALIILINYHALQSPPYSY